jgi:GT2 family glycosyltransferase
MVKQDMSRESVAAIIIPCGPGAEQALDTANSISHYCTEPHDVVFVDDCTEDGTYEKIMANKQPNWHLIRNPRPNGYVRLVQTLCLGYSYIHSKLTTARCILKLDVDALVIRYGVISDALNYMAKNPDIGIFGVYDVDYNRPRSFTTHIKQISRETAWWRSIFGLRPSWYKLLRLAESKGYSRGNNVFGGAYFMTRSCLEGIESVGGFDVPYHWRSRLAEDVYFSMAASAAGYKLGHFAAPDGPLCLEHKGLPYPAGQLWERGFKIVHSVDKGVNTTAAENGGLTAREIYSNIRKKELQQRTQS